MANKIDIIIDNAYETSYQVCFTQENEKEGD